MIYRFLKAPLLLVFIVVLSACKDESKKPEEQPESNSLVVEGKVNVDLDAPAQINIMGFFVDPVYAGVISKSGEFTIELPESFTDSTTAAFKKYNNSPDAQYMLEDTKLGDYFIGVDDLNSSGLSNAAALAGKYYTFSSDAGVTIYPYTSAEFMEDVIQGNNSVAGSYYYFLYSDGDFQIKGEQETDLGTMESIPVNQTTTYNVEGKDGWNILKYSAGEVVSINDTLQIVTSRSHSTVDRIPTNFKWLVKTN